MGRERGITCLIFVVVPVICLSQDTRSLSNMKINFRTDNYSNHILGHHDDLYLRDKYFGWLNRVAESYKDSYIPLGAMRRTLRSFKNDLDTLTSIKREKEEYENLKDLQFYGSETPKKFTVKRLFSPKYFSLLNTNYNVKGTPDIEEVNEQRSDESGLKHSVENETSQHSESTHLGHSESTHLDENDPPLVSKSSMTFNVPEITNDLHSSRNENFYPDTVPISNTFESLGNTADGKDIATSKRSGRRFQPDVCNMDDLEIDVTFHEMMDTEAGLFRLTCTGTVIVNKCEGACNSHVKPSVNNYDGVERQCSCCKDASIRSRTVTLSMCTLGPEEVHGYSISRTIVEPTACSCQQCRN
ncbi:uncharacterized protein LOC123532627 [Mercenaria mercenaria]|uniref:uncharacterized protein LOC123532627 n=1 Tax=Mercenaria mercenaria TaxID=6596 RepID=UPI001E1DD275|nr:uncharacterized protein LOC123532627 [Mercenaria mercenaria]